MRRYARWPIACAHAVLMSSPARRICWRRANHCARRWRAVACIRWSCGGRRARARPPSHDSSPGRAAAQFLALSAVMAGVKDIRAAVEQARAERRKNNRPTVLFLDEVHRFNKAQQDTFLPFLEDGTLIFIGATTENPSFEVISALLSRARVYVLKSLGTDDLLAVLNAALNDTERGLGLERLRAPPDALDLIARAADGDARRALNMLELAAGLVDARGGELTLAIAQEVASGGRRRFDKGGDQFYDQISALHKAVRGTDPDGALYWLSRMLDGGCDPSYVARRVVRMAVERRGYRAGGSAGPESESGCLAGL